MMKVETFYYKQGKWSTPVFPDLDSVRTLIFIFGASQYGLSSAPIMQLLDTYKKSHIIGCSTAGEILQNSLSDESLSVAVVKFEHTDIKIAFAFIDQQEDSFKAGKTIMRNLPLNNLSHVFLLSAGTNVNGTELVNGVRDQGRKDVMITGGLAGDGTRFQSTWVLSRENGIRANGVVGVGFYGNHIKVAYGSQGGWDVFGPARMITKSDKNVLYEIDGQSVLPLYKKYLGEYAKQLPSAALLFPMAIKQSAEDTALIVRTILSVDEKNQSLIFAGNMPQGWLAQLMTANFERLIEGASNAGTLATMNEWASDILTVAISCVGRRLVLGERTEEEVEAALSKLPAKVKLVGFYSYGEISPSGVINCDLHNQTMTLTTFAEE